MRKALSGILFLFVFLFAHSLLAQGIDFSKAQVHVQKVSGSVYMLTGVGGNVTILVTNDGLLTVDTEFPQIDPKIYAAIRKLSDKPLRYAIDTHWHSDHSSGNAYFRSKGAMVIAQDNVRRILATGTMRDGREYFPAEPDMLPELTYRDQANIYLGGDEIRLFHAPHGHTDGDTIVYFVKDHVLTMGDDYRTDGFPLVDDDNGGTVKGMYIALEKIIKDYPPDTKVIPGHGPTPMTVADIRPFAHMLEDCYARVEKGMQEGKTVQQLQQEKVLTGYESYSHRITSNHFISMIYTEILLAKQK